MSLILLVCKCNSEQNVSGVSYEKQADCFMAISPNCTRPIITTSSPVTTYLNANFSAISWLLPTAFTTILAWYRHCRASTGMGDGLWAGKPSRYV